MSLSSRILLVLALLAPVATPPQVATVRQLLDAYRTSAEGPLRDQLLRHFEDFERGQRFLKELKVDAAAHDAIVVAAFAAEAADVAAVRYPPLAFEILELACDRVRRADVPAEFLLQWNVAAISIIGRPLDDSFLGAWGRVHFVRASKNWESHLEHSGPTVRDAPPVAFAWGVSRQAALHTMDLTWRRYANDRGMDADNARARRAFELAKRDPGKTAETRVRLAWLNARAGRKAQAIDDWKSIASADAPSQVRYLALLLHGRLLLETNSYGEAATLFERALTQLPDEGHAAWLNLSIARAIGRLSPLREPVRPDKALDDPWLRFFESFSGIQQGRRHAIEIVRGLAR